MSSHDNFHSALREIRDYRLTSHQIHTSLLSQFTSAIKIWYNENRRQLPWRETDNQFYIYVSEIMLQQTQVNRVLLKYDEFIQKFKTFYDIANSDIPHLITSWQGLGYNRRILNLYKASTIICNDYSGNVPDTYNNLLNLPGIGAGTAGSLLAFIHNKPSVFIETNIRTLYSYAFFPDRDQIDDKSLMPLIEQTVDIDNPREWYYALMDAGSYLKQSIRIPNSLSKHYTKQSQFSGSKREIRGGILKILGNQNQVSLNEIQTKYPETKHDIQSIAGDLINEGFILCDSMGNYALNTIKKSPS